jgi:3-hydroxyisobutyrate dehydrogenase-like beta-hydroxyacid dehydrogenase
VPLGERPVVGVLHPGAMGAALGAALKPVAAQVIWAAAGRSDATSKRAEIADLVAVPDLAELVARSDLVISICPPHAAVDIARAVRAAARGDRPAAYLDANAVAPATVAAIAELLGPDRVVDGAVIGAPAWRRADTVLWLAGGPAAAVAALFAASPFEARVLPGGLGSASALKACFALQSKALPTLWSILAEAAQRYGVADEVRAELARDGIDLDAQLDALDRRARGKAWRWSGEMDEVAAAVAAVGLPAGFASAAAETYRRLAADRPTSA